MAEKIVPREQVEKLKLFMKQFKYTATQVSKFLNCSSSTISKELKGRLNMKYSVYLQILRLFEEWANGDDLQLFLLHEWFDVKLYEAYPDDASVSFKLCTHSCSDLFILHLHHLLVKSGLSSVEINYDRDQLTNELKCLIISGECLGKEFNKMFELLPKYFSNDSYFLKHRSTKGQNYI